MATPRLSDGASPPLVPAHVLEMALPRTVVRACCRSLRWETRGDWVFTVGVEEEVRIRRLAMGGRSRSHGVEEATGDGWIWPPGTDRHCRRLLPFPRCSLAGALLGLLFGLLVLTALIRLPPVMKVMPRATVSTLQSTLKEGFTIYNLERGGGGRRQERESRRVRWRTIKGAPPAVRRLPMVSIWHCRAPWFRINRRSGLDE